MSARLGGLAAGCALLALVAAGSLHAAPPTEAEYHNLCRAITAQHVRALFTAPVAPIQLGGSSDCAFFPRGGNAVGGVQVFLRIDDGDQTLWKHRGDHSYGPFRTLTGAGQHAKWGYQGGRQPSVVDARTGSFTCTIIPGDDPTKFVHTAGTPLSAAAVSARRLVRLCGDVFAAYR